MRRAKLVSILVLSALFTSTGVSTSSSLYDLYRSREFGRFQSDLKRVTDFRPLLDEARGTSASWPADVGAAYLLEVSAAAFSAEWFPRLPGPSQGRRPSFSGGAIGAPRRTNCIGLLRLASTMAQRMPADAPAGRAWARAAIALLEGTSEVPPPRDVPPPGFSAAFGAPGPEALPALLTSMRDRLDEATIAMARGHIYEAEVASAVSYDLPTALGNVLSPDGLALRSSLPAIRSWIDRAVAEGMKAFQEAQAFPSVRAEAAVRWGALALTRDQQDDVSAALGHFRAAREFRPDSDVLYVSWLLEGQARRQLGESDASTRAFRVAADLSPSGSAARLGWAVQAFLAGDEDTANQLAQQILAMPVTGDDPWVLFQQSDYRHWASRIADLREAIQ